MMTTSASNLRLSGYSTERFLVVNVDAGATQSEIIKAVENALRTSDIPYFPNITPAQLQCLNANQQQTDPGGMNPGQASPKNASQQPSDPGRIGPGQAFFMMVRTEGW
jgi:hypothetical protein